MQRYNFFFKHPNVVAKICLLMGQNGQKQVSPPPVVQRKGMNILCEIAFVGYN
jgi:hypothetical protein